MTNTQTPAQTLLVVLQRSIEQWRNSDPAAMAKQSDAALQYAFEDAKHDIIALYNLAVQLSTQAQPVPPAQALSKQEVIELAREAVQRTHKFDLRSDTIHMTAAAIHEFAALLRGKTQ